MNPEPAEQQGKAHIISGQVDIVSLQQMFI